MKITLKPIKIKDVAVGYTDNGDDGVFAYDGKLTIRPPYQREFVYDLKEEKAVVDTIINGFPLNIMYWVKNGENSFEILDGQQRTLSVLHFLDHKFAIDYNGHQVYVDSLTDDIYNKIMEYEFMIYECEGTDSEKLSWFKIVNVAGKELYEQELRNSAYTGTWLTDAKKHFSKRNCVAKNLSSNYIKGDPNRQELLEKALKGICEYQGIKGDNAIEEYMAKHKSDNDANELWQYFQDVISWVNKIFENYRREMLGLDWCHLYNVYHNNTYNSKNIEEELKKIFLNENDEFVSFKGVYEYVLCKEFDPFAERLLNIREFSKKDKAMAYEKQAGNCAICKKHFDIDEMEADHIIPWSKGGLTNSENCQMLCQSCNRHKSNK